VGLLYWYVGSIDGEVVGKEVGAADGFGVGDD